MSNSKIYIRLRKLLFLNVTFFFFLCFNVSARDGADAQPLMKEMGNNYVEVLYFHGKRRCATCMAIESNTGLTMRKFFAKQIKNGKVFLKIIDISKKENEKIAEKYEVTWSSLIIVRHKNGKETYKNMTEFAFANARKSPDVFRAGVVKSVNEMLR